MAQQIITTTPHLSGLGNKAYESFEKCNGNFSELYLRTAPVAATYAAARAAFGQVTGDKLNILGRTGPADGGEGVFTWMPGATTTVDDGFELAAAGGIWLRDASIITYDMFGAVQMTSFADTSHDNAAAINACHLALPSYTTARKPYKILLQGLYGIKSTVNFLKLAGIEIVGTANYGELGSGYIWAGPLSSATHSLYFSGNRYLKMSRLRISANSETLTRANAQKSAICIASDYTTSIQERCTFEDIVIGGRDTFDGQSSGLDYQFINGFTGEAITGTFGNNDFHLFESVRQQNVGIGWNNQDSQSVCWVIRNSKVWASDTFASLGSTTLTCYDIEADLLRSAAFIIGQSGSDSNIIRIHGYTNESNFAEFAIINGDCSLSVERAGIDGNKNPANLSVVNPAHPYFIVAASAGTQVITLEQVRFFTIPPVIDFGTTSALKHLIVKGGRPDTIAVRNTGAGMGQDQRIVFHWEPGAGTWQLGDADWAPFTQLIYPPYNLVPDYKKSELPTERARIGRLNVSSGIDIINIPTLASSIPAGATFTFTGALPVGLLLGVSLHISSPPPGPTSINIGDGTTAARWGNKVNTSGLLNNPPEASLIAAFTDAGPVYNKTVGNVVLTAVGGAFAGGFSQVVLTVTYMELPQRLFNPSFSG